MEFDLRMKPPLRMLGGVIVLLAAILAGCTHMASHDGPPDYYVDDTKIPNAVPKLQPISKYGNKPFYTVFGKRYYVLPSSKNYEEQGIASWYGTKFHAHSTSNGERYDMLGMTAAHKSLPLPTFVEVTNLSNGKKVIVKVNDRGPFESNRLIDLSYVAAKKLGMLGHGTARVDVKSIDPRDVQFNPELIAKTSQTHRYFTKTTKVQTAANNTRVHTFTKEVTQTKTVTKPIETLAEAKQLPQGSVYIQVGAFRNLAHAERFKKHLSGLITFPVAITPVHSNLYRVQVGPFKDVAAAHKVTQELKAMGMQTAKIKDNFDIG